MRSGKVVVWVVFMAILAAEIIERMSFRLEGKGAYNKNGDFLRVADECDILFLGTSHVTNAVYPMELWKDFGITSYNISGYGHPVAVSECIRLCGTKGSSGGLLWHGIK